MLGRLKQSHFAIIPAEAYIPLQPGPGSRDGAPGLDVRLIDGRVLVTTVEGDSPAARAGIKPGWEIVAIEGKEVAPMVESDPLVLWINCIAETGELSFQNHITAYSSTDCPRFVPA